MSKIPAFQTMVFGNYNIDGIYEKIVNNIDIELMEKELVISYDKFPDKLPNIDDLLKGIYFSYFKTMENEGYRFYHKGDILIEKYLVVCPKGEYKGWSQAILSSEGKKLGVSLNIHIFLNDSDLFFDYFCPFLDDIENIKVAKGQVVCYPNFWGSLFRHPGTNQDHITYIRCIIGLPL